MLDLALQIVNYRTRQYLPACLDSLRADLKDSGLRYRILILDNASGDDLSELQARDQDIELHESATNVGFGAGYNLLARQAQARSLLILNPDVRFTEPRTTMRLLATLQRTADARVAGPRLFDARGRPQRWDHARLRPGFRSSRARARERTEAAWVSGAVFLIEKALFDSLQGFDENIFLYGEELELCLRIRKAGYKVIYDRAISALHIGQVSAKRKDHIYKSYGYILDKHYRHSLLYYPLKALTRLLG